NSKIGFGDLILLLRYFFKLKVSTHPSHVLFFSPDFYNNDPRTTATITKTTLEYCQYFAWHHGRR
ncbi:hypothetical protein CAS80_07470, partial [Acinetobacter baumannii]